MKPFPSVKGLAKFIKNSKLEIRQLVSFQIQ